MPRRRERGLALLSVLWVSALLATIAAGFATDTRTESRLARNLQENLRAEALADAGVHHAVRRLYRLDVGVPWRHAGTRYRFGLAGGEITVRIDDEDGKIDVNYAPPELIQGLMTALEVDPVLAETLTARILDFRDPDQEALPLGAEDEAYFAAGLEQGARDAPLTTLNELLLVLGMTEDIYARLRPHVTIYTGSDGIDPLRAAPEVLRALPGVDEATVETILNLGADQDPYDVLDDERLLAIEPYLQFSNETVFNVTSVGRSAHGGVFVRTAVIELSGDDRQPFLVLEWRRGRLEDVEPAPASAGQFGLTTASPGERRAAPGGPPALIPPRGRALGTPGAFAIAERSNVAGTQVSDGGRCALPL